MKNLVPSLSLLLLYILSDGRHGELPTFTFVKFVIDVNLNEWTFSQPPEGGQSSLLVSLFGFQQLNFLLLCFCFCIRPEGKRRKFISCVCVVRHEQRSLFLLHLIQVCFSWHANLWWATYYRQQQLCWLDDLMFLVCGVFRPSRGGLSWWQNTAKCFCLCTEPTWTRPCRCSPWTRGTASRCFNFSITSFAVMVSVTASVCRNLLTLYLC